MFLSCDGIRLQYLFLNTLLKTVCLLVYNIKVKNHTFSLYASLRLFAIERNSMQPTEKIVNERPETELLTKDFFYELPEELIAQSPSEERDGCRLMVLERDSGNIEHKIFKNIIDYLNPEDILVVNSSKVIPARLIGTSDKTGSPIELLLLRAVDNGEWETLVRPGKRAKVGASFSFGGILRATVTDIVEGGNRTVSFEYDKEKYGNIYSVLDEVGNMPLPPYITRKLERKSDYQTVYAKEEGSAAAPTAGLHFTEALLEKIKAKGVGYAEVTLHVGLGTFRPVKADKITEHQMHGEFFHIEPEVAAMINERRAKGGRVIAVGTTATRVLESASLADGTVVPMSAETSIFIYPGYKFKATDALITNFHLPESTLIMLVSAMAGKDNVMNAYREAVMGRYRFFSFGDAMLIV